jgi:hypothetical protein
MTALLAPGWKVCRGKVTSYRGAPFEWVGGPKKLYGGNRHISGLYVLAGGPGTPPHRYSGDHESEMRVLSSGSQRRRGHLLL